MHRMRVDCGRVAMLNRQKALIHLVKAAGRPVSRYELTKWSFLLRNEFGSAGGSSFYDFVPYQYGPFSFTLYQELDKLEATSYLRQKDDLVCLGDRGLVDSVELDSLAVAHDISTLVGRFGKTRKDALTEHVYGRYPA